MKIRHRRGRCGREGWTLLVVAMISMAAIMMASTLLTTTLSASRESATARFGAAARHLAEAAMEVASNRIPAEVQLGLVPADGTVLIGGTNVPYTVTPTGFAATESDPSGLQSQLTGYQITATARSNGHQAVSRRILNVETSALFQFAVFYNGTLEIQPGPSMTLSGRIHSNGDLHMGSGGVLTLDTNYVRAVGGVFAQRKDNGAISTGDIQIRKWVADPFNPAEPSEYFRLNTKSYMDALGVPTTSGYDSLFTGYDSNSDLDYDDPGDWLPWALGALDYWSEPSMYLGGTGNTVKSSVHGVPVAVPPSVDSIAAFEPTAGGDFDWNAGTQSYVQVPPGSGSFKKGGMHADAGLSILARPNGTWTATNAAGIDVSSDLVGAVSIQTIYDARQAGGGPATTQVVKVDMAQLNASGRFPVNGKLYAAWTQSGTGTEARGIQLVQGAELANDLTVVSENPLYVQGDYNTVAKKSAAVIADAVNLLSNAWNGSKAQGSGVPVASDTTFNMAMVTGGPETSSGNYSGGFENLPRFHENWSGKPCRILGSFVKLWECQHATGAWSSATYSPPLRLWSYDTDFNEQDNLPPGTPIAVTSVDVVSW